MKTYRINIPATTYKNILSRQQTATALLSSYGLTISDVIEFKCDNDIITTEITNIQHIEDIEYVIISFKLIKINDEPVPKIFNAYCDNEVLDAVNYVYKIAQSGLDNADLDKDNVLKEIKTTLEYLMYN